MQFLDTNILLYSISRNRDEQRKRASAEELLSRDDCALSIQVLQEFYVQATRPTRTDALSHDIAAALVETWMRFPVQDITAAILRHALNLKKRYQFSYWDCAVIAGAHALGCEVLNSEDLKHGQIVEGLRIINPFR
ncbi:MAG TPA: PIN domain-containing protein [Rhizomicrobium sp.]|jgi:predicted nucleic acid-binding protein|nr:PIN domain-containing protein [Rhizomicrobium sp.]